MTPQESRAHLAGLRVRAQTHAVFDKVIVATQQNELPHYAAAHVDDYFAVLANGDWLTWGAVHSGGRDLIIGLCETVGIRIIFLPGWRDA